MTVRSTPKPPAAGPGRVPFPTRDQVLAFIHDSDAPVGRREIARAFGITGAQRTELRALLKDLEADGALTRGRGRRVAPPDSLPEVAVVHVSHSDAEGDLFCRPEHWPEGQPAPRILLWPEPRGRAKAGRGRPGGAIGAGPEIGVGDRLLVRLSRVDDGRYDARPIRRLGSAPTRLFGLLVEGPEGLRCRPASRKDRDDIAIPRDQAAGAAAGELVAVDLLPGRRQGLRLGRVVERLGAEDGPRSLSLLVLHALDIPTVFSDEALAEAAAAGPVSAEGREDLRALPLVTVDGADARDFDDAVFARPDPDPANPGGVEILVAIADVAQYVRPGSALDHAARERGNSVYFPDRVIPMLPEALSNGWCSLRPDEDRGCLAVWMTLDADGVRRRHRFVRGLMRSAARLTYDQLQEAADGRPDATTAPLMDAVVRPLYHAYAILARARQRRGALDLDLPEKQVFLDPETGAVARIEPRVRRDSHRLIEEFMIAANVAAAETLEARHHPCLYRVHDQPAAEKVVALAEFLSTLGISFPKGTVQRADRFNGVLAKVRGTAQEHMVNEIVLRSQAQAEYSPDGIGHFGLALRSYAHFTSPIRRYADLIIHRSLIRALDLGSRAEALPDGAGDSLDEIGRHITATERRAAQAERDVLTRYTAAYLQTRVGAIFAGRIAGVTRAGLFVVLDETGADGLVPISTLPGDYYRHDEAAHCLRGQDSGLTFHLGAPVEVMLREANPISGGLLFALVKGGQHEPPEGRRGRGRPPGRGRGPGSGRGDTGPSGRGAGHRQATGRSSAPSSRRRVPAAGRDEASDPSSPD